MALGSSLINLCADASQTSEVVLLLANRDNQPVRFHIRGNEKMIAVVHCRLSPRSRIRDHLFWILLMSLLYRLVALERVRASIRRSSPWIDTVVAADLVGDVRGGDSFSDIYGLSGFLVSFVMAWSVLLVKGTMVQFPQTYGPFKSPVARCLARYLLTRSTVIIARDKESQKVAQELVGPRQEVLLSPDVAFSLEAIQPKQIELDPPLSGDIPHGVIGLNVNGLMYHGGFNRRNMFGLKLDYANCLPELVTALLGGHTCELWLIPHTYAPRDHVESDNDASAKLRESLPPELRRRVRIVTAEYDQHQLKGIIGQCDFFIGSRMHSCIAALSQGVPCVGVAYSMKFAGVFESVGMNDWVVDARSTSQDEAVARIVSLYHQRNAVRQKLSDQAGHARQQLTEVFRDLMSRTAPPTSEKLPLRREREEAIGA